MAKLLRNSLSAEFIQNKIETNTYKFNLKEYLTTLTLQITDIDLKMEFKEDDIGYFEVNEITDKEVEIKPQNTTAIYYSNQVDEEFAKYIQSLTSSTPGDGTISTIDFTTKTEFNTLNKNYFFLY